MPRALILCLSADRRGNRFEATFDERTGLPLSVNLITALDIADGGARYEFRALKPGLFAAP